MANTLASVSINEGTTSEYEKIRVLALGQLRDALRSFRFEAERVEFSRLFDRAQSILELDDTELARTLRVSRPTIGRWARGESAPHPLGRRPVFYVLADIAEAKLKRHASHQKGVSSAA
jgi:transcriptional regulator with XRE-family HTH domain